MEKINFITISDSVLLHSYNLITHFNPVIGYWTTGQHTMLLNVVNLTRVHADFCNMHL